jgi:hypothetical protein
VIAPSGVVFLSLADAKAISLNQIAAWMSELNIGIDMTTTLRQRDDVIDVKILWIYLAVTDSTFSLISNKDDIAIYYLSLRTRDS